MAKSYVNDISQFLDLANRENVKILGGKTLIWYIWIKLLIIYSITHIKLYSIYFPAFCRRVIKHLMKISLHSLENQKNIGFAVALEQLVSFLDLNLGKLKLLNLYSKVNLSLLQYFFLGNFRIKKFLVIAGIQSNWSTKYKYVCIRLEFQSKKIF